MGGQILSHFSSLFDDMNLYNNPLSPVRIACRAIHPVNHVNPVKLTRFLRLQHLCSMCLSAIAFAAADFHPWLRLKKSKQALTQTRILSAQLPTARLHETLEFPNKPALL
jgi:hypothetical protein